MTWPLICPPDLFGVLTPVLSREACGPAEIWNEVRDWLIALGVQPPAEMPEDGTTIIRPSGLSKAHTFYNLDGLALAVINEAGLGMISFGGNWGPKGGSAATAEEVYRNSRSTAMTDTTAFIEMERIGIKPPEF